MKNRQLNHIVLPLIFVLFLTSIALKGQGQLSTCLGQAGEIEWTMFEMKNGESLLNPNYPQNPSRTKIIRSLETEPNYNDYYTSIIRGFIKAPVSGKYYFNVTGSDVVEFFLSTNDSAANKQLLVNTSYTSYAQFDQNANQTDSVDLISGEYYYFEVNHSESTGNDLIRVSWKTPSNNETWKTISSEYLYKYTCTTYCTDKGTPCDDGNSETINDQYDGACNCFGIPKNLPDCAGNYGQVQALYFDSIQGTTIAELLNSPNYPLQPSRAEILTEMRIPNRSTHDYFGSLVKACLYVPVSGNYEFSSIGNTAVEVYFDSLSDYSTKKLITNSSGRTSTLQLEANRFYYISLIHKENLNAEEFALLWKTPFSTDQKRKYIDGAYLFQYNCELACIPDGTPCNDNNPETINDAYNNCNCVGTYCPNGDCDEEPTFIPYDACETTGKHSIHIDDSWLSCEKNQSMNPTRGNAHWIQYDLGSVMPVGTSHIWNYNVAGNTGKGFRTMAIDLSVDGKAWTEFGVYEWPEALGSNEYKGFAGPDFTGNSARYILLSGLTNWNGSDCSGFSEIEFQVAACPTAGTLCDDHNDQTENDRYDFNCLCRGDIISSTVEIETVDQLKLYPNPANSWTNIFFYLAETNSVDMVVYDISGRIVCSIANNQTYEKGYHHKLFPAHQLKAGNYLVQLKTGKNIITEKLIVTD